MLGSPDALAIPAAFFNNILLIGKIPRGYKGQNCQTDPKYFMNFIQVKSSEITHGFSGGPLWDENQQCVIGMLVEIIWPSAPDWRLGETAFAVPVEDLKAAINIALNVSLFPPKGMTLPFVSYGGSSLIAAGITLGILLCFTRTRPQGEIRDALKGRLR